MIKNYLRSICMMLLLASSTGLAQNDGTPDENRNFAYLSTNLVRALHTVSVGFWDFSPNFGMNITNI